MPTLHLRLDITVQNNSNTTLRDICIRIEIFKFDSDAIQMMILNQTAQIFSKPIWRL